MCIKSTPGNILKPILKSYQTITINLLQPTNVKGSKYKGMCFFFAVSRCVVPESIGSIYELFALRLNLSAQ